MQCKNCGCDIKEGMDYCMSCGAPVSEPAVITITKESLKKEKSVDEGPFFDFSGYLSGIKSSTAGFLALLGSLLIYLSTFSSWIWSKLFDSKVSANLFDMGTKSQDLYMGSSKFFILAIVTILIGVSMFALSASKYIKPLKAINNDDTKNLIISFIPVILAIIVFVLIFKDHTYSEAYNNIKNQLNLAKSIGSSTNFKGGRGAGPIFYLVGTGIYTLSIIIKKVSDK